MTQLTPKQKIGILSEREIESAKAELVQWEAMKLLVKNNTIAAEIHVAGMSLGTCKNSSLLPVIQENIGEIKKYLKGLPNKYE